MDSLEVLNECKKDIYSQALCGWEYTKLHEGFEYFEGNLRK